MAAHGPGMDLRPCIHCSRCGHHATVPEETIRRAEDPGVHVSPVSHPLHLHQDFGGYDCRWLLTKDIMLSSLMVGRDGEKEGKREGWERRYNERVVDGMKDKRKER